MTFAKSGNYYNAFLKSIAEPMKLFLSLSFLFLIHFSFAQSLPPSYEGFWHSQKKGVSSLAISGNHMAWKNHIWNIASATYAGKGSFNVLIKDSLRSEKMSLALKGSELLVSDGKGTYSLQRTFIPPKLNDVLLSDAAIKPGVVELSGKICKTDTNGLTRMISFSYFNEFKGMRETFYTALDKDGLFHLSFPVYHVSEITLGNGIRFICAPGDHQIIFLNGNLSGYSYSPERAGTISSAIEASRVTVHPDSVNKKVFFMGDHTEFNRYYTHFQYLSTKVSRELPYDNTGNKHIAETKEEIKNYFHGLQKAALSRIDESYNASLCGEEFIGFIKHIIKFRMAYALCNYIRNYNYTKSGDVFSRDDYQDLLRNYFTGVPSYAPMIPEFRESAELFYGHITYLWYNGFMPERDSIVALIQSGALVIPEQNKTLVLDMYKKHRAFYVPRGTAVPDTMVQMIQTFEELSDLTEDYEQYYIIHKELTDPVLQSYLSLCNLAGGFDEGIPLSRNRLTLFRIMNANAPLGTLECVAETNNILINALKQLPVYTGSPTSCFPFLKNEYQYRTSLAKDSSSPVAVIMLSHYYDHQDTEEVCAYINEWKKKYPTVHFRIFIKKRNRTDADEIQRQYALCLQKYNLLEGTQYISDSVSLFYEWYFSMNGQSYFKTYAANGVEFKSTSEDRDYEKDFETIILRALKNNAVQLPANYIVQTLLNDWRLLYEEDHIQNFVYSRWKNAAKLPDDLILTFTPGMTYSRRRINQNVPVDSGTYTVDGAAMTLTLTSSSGHTERFRILSFGKESLILQKI